MRKVLLRVLFVTCLGFTGCASKWVKHPEVDGVKKVAIVSVFSGVEIKGDRGSKSSGNDAAALSNVLGKQNAETDWRIRLVTFTAKAYTDAFKAAGWQVMPIEAVAKSPAYQKAATPPSTGNETLNAVVGFLGKVAMRNYVTPPGTQAIDLTADKERANSGSFSFNGGSSTVLKLKDLAHSLGVDAVAVIEVRSSFDESAWTWGTGHRSVRPEAATRLDIINKDGEYAVTTPSMKEMQKFEANESVYIQNGRMNLDNKSENLFRQAITKSVSANMTRIRTEMAKN